VEKSSLLAVGISAAMNATLVGLTISVACILAYSFLRTRVDVALAEIDRYAIAIMKILSPPEDAGKSIASMVRRNREAEEAADTDVTPMLNLMVLLIPFLLTSSEFVKIGALELKLPEGGGGGGGGGGMEQQQKATTLELGIAITSKGFNLYHYFKGTAAAVAAGADAEIPLKRGSNGKYEYDYEALNKQLQEVKRKVLFEIVKGYYPGTPPNATLAQLYNTYVTKNLSGTTAFADHESVKIVAEGKIKYQTVVWVMDAARGVSMPSGNVTMFPNVSIAAGIF